ncbi:hypothetical protein [Methylobacterium isbiliense]|uniref:Uncharacterized protein n=1 Tax=Methylobacterium isbiliense TaxID=315478 RepID=A0ABQ4SIE1_9HYPH|nr:hypothetical protein [Methylobacterium isbiliense]MDN3626969.1 hypothetical protein [Methylobacterium isbiliense]GJE02912.1 hypothetical protein GMJLKIPL_4862 [Methylobacterium isbiliense]
MRFAFTGVAASILAICCGGCSIYPLPEDVTSYQSKDIVRITRCQAREAVRDEIISTLHHFKDFVVYERMTGEQLADWLNEDRSRFRTIDLSKLAPRAKRLYTFYADTSISYDFTIDSIENNVAGFDLTLLKQLTNGSNSVGLLAKNDRTRQVKRQFRNYDGFDSLARRLPESYCATVPRFENPIYPSTGLTRINTLVKDFVWQNQHENLGSKTSATDADMNDTIMFTTKTTGNIDPTISTSPLTGSTIPTSLKISVDNYRWDVHTIIVLISLPSQRDKIVLYDQYGNITGIGKSTIDEKFQIIRDNNFRDDFNKISLGVARIVP